MKIALAQINSHRSVEENLTLVKNHAKEARESGARLVLFPEATHRNLFEPHESPTLLEVAEARGGRWSQCVKNIAAEVGINIVLGMYTNAINPSAKSMRIRNTLLAVGPDLAEDVLYDKIHLYDAFGHRESDVVEPGGDPQMLHIDGITFGLATCFDLRFPQLFQHYANNGAHAVLVAASWAAGEDKAEQWRTLVKARALDSTCYVVACDQADPRTNGKQITPGEPTGIGHSMIIGPEGSLITSAGTGIQLLHSEISIQRVEQARRSIPVLANARDWNRS